MGGCLSCWGKRKKDVNGERQPLLASKEETISSGLQKVSECLGALSAGKIPSEAQLETMLRSTINSGILADDDLGGYGPLSQRGQRALQDLKEVIEAVLHIGMEKNYDDAFQEAYFDFTKLDRHSAKTDLKVHSCGDDLDVEAIEAGLPTKEEVQADTRSFIRSVRALFSLFISSSSFRLLLSDLFVATREIMADTAARVGTIAKNVEDQAFKAEHGLRPNGDGPPAADQRALYEEAVETASSEANEHINELGGEAPAIIRERFMRRWEELLDRACQNPAYRASLLTILSLMEKYYTLGYSAASDVLPSTSDGEQPPIIIDTKLKVEPELAAFMAQFKIVLERLAHRKSLDPLLDQLHSSLHLLAASPDQLEMRAWLEDVGRYLQRALNEPERYRSHKFHEEAEALYDRAQEILESEKRSEWVTGFRTALAELSDFISALEHDKATQRLARALESLLTDTGYLFRVALGLGVNVQKQIRREIRQDLLTWLLPRLLRFIRAIPMPRVEFASPSLDAVIDSLVLTAPSASLLPDHVHLQVLEEIRLDMSSGSASHAQGDSNSSHVRTKLHLDGIRVAAHGISYYVDAKGPAFLGWQDNGLLDAQVGKIGHTGQGIEVDLDLDTDLDVEKRSVFRALDVKLDVPGLTFRIDQSRHWLINKLFLQWAAGPTVRRLLSWILTSQLQQALESADARLFNIYERASERQTDETQPSLGDYWQATLDEFSGDQPSETSPDVGDEASELTITQAQTQASLTGLTYTSTTQDVSGDAQPATTKVAIGVGEQILPGKGGPVLEEESPAEVARETVYEVEQSLEQGKDTVQGAGREALHTREQMAQAQEQMAQTQEEERRKRGWRSAVFDI